MVCQVCGRMIGGEQRFCSVCGTRVALEAPPVGTPGYPPVSIAPARASGNRVERHQNLLGILWCVYGGFRLLRGIIGIVILHTLTLRSFGDGGWPMGGTFSPVFPVWLNALLPMIAAFTILGTVLSFATGYALLTRRPWGRTIAIVAAVLSLIKFPFGTALGVYTLWVLVPAASGAEYEATTQP
jgi:hypothetical protein